MGSYERPSRASDGRNMSTNAPQKNSAGDGASSHGRQTTAGMGGVKHVGTASVGMAHPDRLKMSTMGHGALKGVPNHMAYNNNDTGGSNGKASLSDSRSQTPVNPKERYKASIWKKA